MGILDELAAALTGPPPSPTPNMDANTSFLDAPGARAALLSAGLQMMQPVALGQTAGGHIGQAIGAAGETLGRQEVMDLKAGELDNKVRTAEAKADLAERNAAARDAAANARLGIQGERLALSQQQLDLANRANEWRERQGAARVGQGARRGDQTDRSLDQRDKRGGLATSQAHERQLQDDAKSIAKQASDILLPKDSPLQKYKGMTVPQIREQLRKERPMTSSGVTPADDEEENEDEADPVVQPPTSRTGTSSSSPATGANPGSVQPPVAGARWFPKHNMWAVPDEKNPGKWMKVN